MKFADIWRDHHSRQARLTVLGRAYPLAKQVAELLELEGIEPQATEAKKLRAEIGALLGQRHE